MIYLKRLKVILIIIFVLVYNYSIAQDSWTKVLPGLGSFSSPRVTDLNNDGIGDVIFGAGREEFKATDSAVIALNGKNGEMLWKVSAKDQMFGSATLKDINNDGVLDIFIGGRSAELIAINGKSGEVIWRFKAPATQKSGWFNFYNPQFIPDQNNDGYEDILVSNGGDVLAEPYDLNRSVGHLVILDGQNGELIVRAPMPDGKETYMSVSVLPNASGTFKNVIFGTGGETIGGNLFVTSLDEILKGDLSNSIKLDSSKNKGFVGPAVWVDINEDDIPDIVANTVDGRLLAFDGVTHKKIWEVHVPNTEAYSSVAVGNFTKDSIPDFFVSYAQGVWPELKWSKQIMVNGKSGDIEFEDTLGFYQLSTPVVVDLDGDGLDEVLLSMNYQETDQYHLKYFYTNLAIIDFIKKEAVILKLNYPGHNMASTPWIGDIDNNGIIDIIYLHSNNIKQTYTFDGIQINRIDTKNPVYGKIKWGSYMGSNYNGIFEK